MTGRELRVLLGGKWRCDQIAFGILKKLVLYPEAYLYYLRFVVYRALKQTHDEGEGHDGP